MDCQVPKDVVAERFERLLALQNEISYESNKKLEGKTLRVLCDGPSKNNPDTFSGRTEGSKIVLFEGESADVGKFVEILIERADTFALSGKIIRK